MKILAILGTTNEHECITVLQISAETGIDEETVRRYLEWGVKNQQLSGTLDGDMFVRRHRMRKLHIEYTNWHETQGK
jgi:response regulator of citrate/malate metabolism